MTTTKDPGLVGTDIPEVRFPLSVYRLVMEAGANRDFNSIHHNTEYARATGAPEMYANTLFLMGMWERAVREWAGDEAIITAIRGFRMRKFNLAGTTTVVKATVVRHEPQTQTVTLRVHSECSGDVTVGPGEVDVQLPSTP